MSEGSRFRYLGIGLAVLIVVGIVFVKVPTSSTGVALVGCDYDSGGNAIGCSNSFNVPIGQSVVNVGGNPVAKIGIPKAFVILNYTGFPNSGTFTAIERIDYAKGISDSYPISVSIPSSSSSTYSCSGTASPCPPNTLSLQKNFSLTLPVSSWTASFLQSKWGQFYGSQMVNVTVANSVVKLIYSGVSPPAKPSAFNFVAQFKLNYLAPITTTTTSTSLTSATTISSSSTTTTSVSAIANTSTSASTMTSSTTFATSTSTSTAISGGTISTGTVNVWPSATTQITGGKVGANAPSGVLVAVAPGSQSEATVYLPASVVNQNCAAGCAFSISLLTQGTSTTQSLPASASNIGSTQIGLWKTLAFLVSTAQGDSVVVQVNLGSAQVFNQAVTVDGSTTSVTYTDLYGRTVMTPVLTPLAAQFQAWYPTYVAYQNAQTAATNAASTDPCNRYGPVYNAANCRASLQSVVSLQW